MTYIFDQSARCGDDDLSHDTIPLMHDPQVSFCVKIGGISMLNYILHPKKILLGYARKGFKRDL
jgi:hypothetical protein